MLKRLYKLINPVPALSLKAFVEDLNCDPENAPARLLKHARNLRRQALTQIGLAWAFFSSLVLAAAYTKSRNDADYVFLAGVCLFWVLPLLIERSDDVFGVMRKPKNWCTALSSSSKCIKFEELVSQNPTLALVPAGRELLVADYLYAKERVEGKASQVEADAQRAACARLHSRAA